MEYIKSILTRIQAQHAILITEGIRLAADVIGWMYNFVSISKIVVNADDVRSSPVDAFTALIYEKLSRRFNPYFPQLLETLSLAAICLS